MIAWDNTAIAEFSHHMGVAGAMAFDAKSVNSLVSQRLIVIMAIWSSKTHILSAAIVPAAVLSS